MKNMLSNFLATIAVFSGLASSFGAQAQSGNDDANRYGKCVDTAERAPDRGINLALEWQLEGGGVPARHCEALGLFFAGEYSEAAIRLENLADDMRIGRGMPLRGDERSTATASMLADTYRQAANAWLKGDELERAEAAIGQALALVPEKSALEDSIREDHAYIAAAEGDYQLALEELDFVYRRNRQRTDLLLFIASAARALENYAQAETSLNQYIEAFPSDPSAFLELGNLKDATGDRTAARSAWLKVLSISEVGPDADAARANLERIDVAKN
ncbi:MAG: tetratricopeptide repeat protein [Kordiimonadaceae bacterium]|nr:tetratricopeptide repeat protein [Kordiimonadaceae bacterium]MBO6568407.1 tetratricopeptide repeat protein [Kordiimonadaceae bacterium]MBO6963864.1 tetratricopeptide repeat protein [Kordiimonadaceae bacterium]